MEVVKALRHLSTFGIKNPDSSLDFAEFLARTLENFNASAAMMKVPSKSHDDCGKLPTMRMLDSGLGHRASTAD